MADVAYILCPECELKFKSTADKEGKKVRCPNCDEPFRVTADMITLPRKEKKSNTNIQERPARSAAPKVDELETVELVEEPPALELVATKSALDEEFDEDGNPYGLQDVRVVPRCPSCAKEMADAKSFICVHCGYNTLTREIGKTNRTYDLTFEERLTHLLPALANVVFAAMLAIFLIWFCVVYPKFLFKTFPMAQLDSEAVRLILTFILAYNIYSFGYKGLQQIIFNPKPKEREKDK